jgi:hypothetical protein
MSRISKAIVWIAVLSLVDLIIPVPVVGITVIYALLSRPEWARNLTEEVLNR